MRYLERMPATGPVIRFGIGGLPPFTLAAYGH